MFVMVSELFHSRRGYEEYHLHANHLPFVDTAEFRSLLPSFQIANALINFSGTLTGLITAFIDFFHSIGSFWQGVRVSYVMENAN